jgi:GH15 family glucan-1,4-alpha-glucosidase
MNAAAPGAGPAAAAAAAAAAPDAAASNAAASSNAAARSHPDRDHGYAALRDYAVLADGRTVALVALDGSIDWWPIPTLDAPPVCAALLDPRDGGHFSLSPRGRFDADRRYLPGTNVIESVWTTDTGQVRVTDALNTGTAGQLPWSELVRQVEGISGEVAMAWELQPGDRFGQARSWVSERGGRPVVVLGDQTLAVIVDGTDPPECEPHRVSGSFTVKSGERVLVTVVATDHEPVFLPQSRLVAGRLERTTAGWRRWSDQITYDGPWREAVIRSALALKSLTYEVGGAIAAAATTSLPETVGGAKNWDYRYSWVRDSSFTIDAFINLGLHEEVHGAVSWLLDALERSAPDLHVFYTLNGDVASGETILDVPGWEESSPARAGNSAGTQSQLGTFGDLFDTMRRYINEGHLLDRRSATLLADMADRCCDAWPKKDSGIWELAEPQHYTISKMGCWVALDRATSLARDGHLPDDRSGRWKSEAAEIKAWIAEHCWSDRKQSYTFFAGTEDLDAAVLLAGRTGFDRGPRLASTIEAVAGELGRGPLLYRYTGMDKEEGAFVACTFWMVNALVHVGQIDRARQLMDEGVALANDVGLLSEQIDPATNAFLGNLPQGLSHLALVNAAHVLAEAGL